MDYLALMEQRQSIREFTGKGLSAEQKQALTDFFSASERLVADIDVELVICENDAGTRLEGVAGYRGNAFGAPAYLIILSAQAEHYIENSGFIGENLCLKLTELNLSHCWLTVEDPAATKRALLLESDKEITAVIACGQGKKERSVQRIDISTPASVRFQNRDGHVAPKISQEELVYRDTWGKEMDWSENAIDPGLDQAFYAASLAPSFLNRQPYRFVLRSDGAYLLATKEEMTSENDTRLDVGAVMFHFHTAYKENYGRNLQWQSGVPDNLPDFGAPDEYKVVGYYPLG